MTLVTMKVYTIYESPSDFPGDFVVKLWDYRTDPPKQDLSFVKIAKTLEEARNHIPIGLYNVGRAEADDDCIYESWF